MQSDLVLALQITVIGMGLVFASILLLWGVMVVLVRVTADRNKSSEIVSNAELASAAAGTRRERMRRAATAAVAAALALAEEEDLGEFPLPPTAIVSAWQAVRRSSNLNNRGSRR